VVGTSAKRLFDILKLTLLPPSTYHRSDAAESIASRERQQWRKRLLTYCIQSGNQRAVVAKSQGLAHTLTNMVV
jgi:hypothetical protein